MDDLKIGDKLYNVSQNGFGDFFRYSFSEVVRLTKILAVLENGVRLRNKPIRSMINNEIGYSLATNRWVYWHKVTDEIKQKSREENKKIAVNDWFQQRSFNMQEKKIIYELFEEKGMLEGSEESSMAAIELFKKV
ncbi:pyruvate kinase [Arenibacter sp. M-2]|uniref:pyruvate kinase n=1 Tax=Arenibacter sp. M-2 TaxID=3053612 RepID=UPI0025706235|nr:pyruvate kinase [Arenibacter sp. M-2]MDL5512663.1 pyruvate kinase [Arenibacter sp. M-2]